MSCKKVARVGTLLSILLLAPLTVTGAAAQQPGRSQPGSTNEVATIGRDSGAGVRELAAAGWSSRDLVDALTLAAPPPPAPRTRGPAPEPRCEDYWRQRTRGGSAPFQAVAIQILFAFDSAELSPQSRGDLVKIAEALRSDRLSPCCFEIQGHTDSVGSEAYNLELSQQRARAVVDFLASELGVGAERLIPAGYGEERPLASNTSGEGRQRNRRVQIANLGYGRVELD